MYCTHSAFPFAGVFSETATHQDLYDDVMHNLVEHAASGCAPSVEYRK